MAAPNYPAYDGRDDDRLSLSEAAHLWVEMEPVSKRDGQTHPSPADTGWKYVFWRWLKRQIFKRTGVKPLGHIQYPRGLYRQIAESDEYAALVEVIPKLKARPLFLFPEERPNRDRKGSDATIDAETRCRRLLTKQMLDGPQVKPKPDYFSEAAIGKNAFNRAWANALVDSQNPNDWGKSGRRPKNFGPHK